MWKGNYVVPLVNINYLPKVNLFLGLEKSNTRTEIIYGTQNIIKRTLQRLSATVKKIDVCISSAAVEGTVKAEPIFEKTLRLKEIRTRLETLQRSLNIIFLIAKL